MLTLLLILIRPIRTLRRLKESPSWLVPFLILAAIAVSLFLNPEAARLQVADDGIGFDPAAARKAGGLGLRGMEERAEEMGGTWSVDSSPACPGGQARGTGTTVTVVVPAQTQPGEVPQ